MYKGLQSMFGRKRIYLDYASVTPLDKRVFKVMQPYLVNYVGNPSSLSQEGVEAKIVLDQSRKKVADLLHTTPDTIIFTSGGTEANNIALLGVFEEAKKRGIQTPHIVASSIEHSSVRNVLKEIEMKGGRVTHVAPNEKGFVSAKDVAQALTAETILVTIMLANNEIGTIQPVKELAKFIRNFKHEHKRTLTDFPYLHTDASQVTCYLDISVQSLGLDLMTLDGMKMYGPRGVGMLFKKRTTTLQPILFGGGQEAGLRPGTENIPLVIGFAEALSIAISLKSTESVRMQTLKDFFIEEVKTNIKHVEINGENGPNMLPNILNVCFKGRDSEFLVISLDVHNVSCSAVSSCQNLNEDSSSYVLEAIGKKECASSSIRFSMGRETTKKDIIKTIDILKKLSTE